MIIKNYLPNNTLAITENARNVVVHNATFALDSYSDVMEFGGRQFGPEPFVPAQCQYPVDDDNIRCSDHFVKFIDYSDENDVRHRIMVEEHAYVCNDHGKTIEHVIAAFNNGQGVVRQRPATSGKSKLDEIKVPVSVEVVHRNTEDAVKDIYDNRKVRMSGGEQSDSVKCRAISTDGEVVGDTNV